MSLVAAVRKGQLLPEKYRIRSPEAIISALRDNKKIGASSEAAFQYQNLVALRLGSLVKVHGGRYEFQLIETPENIQAVDEALSLVRAGASRFTGVQQEAQIALTKDENYIQSIAASAKFRSVSKPKLTTDEQMEVEQLLIGI